MPGFDAATSPARDAATNLDAGAFAAAAEAAQAAHPGKAVAVPLGLRLLSDQLTPVLAYRRLVSGDDRLAPSFLFESVEGGERQGRYSLLGAEPALEVVAKDGVTTVTDRRRDAGANDDNEPEGRHTDHGPRDPFAVLRAIADGIALAEAAAALPGCVLGGWFGYAAYDTVRRAEPEKLPLSAAPPDDRGLPDLHFGFYDRLVAFDHVEKLVHLVALCRVEPGDDPAGAFDAGRRALGTLAEKIQRHSRPLPAGVVRPEASRRTADAETLPGTMTGPAFREMVGRAIEYIRAGDIFQVVLGHRLERRSAADPFDVYRALRSVNPSPYLAYLQARGCILVASSPEILCRVEPAGPSAGGAGPVVTNRPLAGTRPRGATPEADLALERDLLADPKEIAEHVMLVDLGRNDVGRVAEPGTIALGPVMSIERYSHVMHISSTVRGALRAGLDCWDALRAALPVGTISGAPKVRAMQIIDELETVRRGPYGGGLGYVGLDGRMDIALALRTIVVPTAAPLGAEPGGPGESGESGGSGDPGRWAYHLQAAAGIVADSKPEAEWRETLAKAAALLRAIELAEDAFGGSDA